MKIEDIFENDPATALHYQAQAYAYYEVRNLLIGYSLNKTVKEDKNV